jgi:hypothetical protein
LAPDKNIVKTISFPDVKVHLGVNPTIVPWVQRQQCKIIAQSFKHNQTWLGRQVCHPDQTRETNLLPSCEFQCDQNARRK